MENTKNKTFIHPEVRLDVIKEFKRLREKHPSLDGNSLWALSRDYVWTMALANSSIIRQELFS